MKYFVIPLVCVLFPGGVFLDDNSAYGLECKISNMTDYFASTDTVFLGKALAKEYQPNPRFEERKDAVTLFSVIESFKGIHQKTVNVTSSEWFWGANFTENNDYVVFATYKEGRLEHALCTPTMLASKSDLELIRQISKDYVLAPLAQVEFGVDPDKVQCKEGLVLVTKSSDGSPACVKPDTKQKLIERGWTKDDKISETKSWNTASDWNSLNLLRNNNNLYCSSTNNKLPDQCYSLEEIVFGNHHKKSEQGWKLYPGGAGWRLPENSTLTPIYKEVKFGIMPLDFAAMLGDPTFVNKCELNGGTWNAEHTDCEGIWEMCKAVGGIRISLDVTPSCTGEICLGAGLVRNSCVFPYEN